MVDLVLAKTVYLILLVATECLLFKLFNIDLLLYPFRPIHATIVVWFTIGIRHSFVGT
ncbi:hypothetical protein [Mycobacterium leprae]|uniref:hypothetical protein n=1 Tax=Mycobacterium leprae TaxID=1769 RepID=UPI000308C6D2